MEPASAGIGIAFAGAQVVGTALKLKRIWRQTCELPDDVQDLLSNLETIGSMLNDSELATGSDQTTVKCLEKCQRSREKLENIAKELESKLQCGPWRKKVNAFRAVLDKDTLEKYKSQLKEALEIFSLAQELSRKADSRQILDAMQAQELNRAAHMETQAKQAQEHSLKLDIVATDVSAVLQLLETRGMFLSLKEPVVPNDRPAALDDTKRKQRMIKYILGSISITSDQADQSWSLQFKTPRWWSGAIHELRAYSQLSTYVFRTYNIVQYNSEIMESIREGDSSRICQLFQSRQASPFDVDAGGQSLLHHAAYHMQPDICSLLLRKGLGEFLHKPIGASRKTPLSMVLRKLYHGEKELTKKRRDEVIEIFQYYLRNSDDLPVDMAFDYVFELETTDERVALFRSKFLLNCYDRPIQERAESIRFGSFTDVCNASSLRKLLRENGEVTSQDIELTTAAHVSLLHSGAVCLGRRYGDKAIPFRRPIAYQYWYTRDWSDWIEDMAHVSEPGALHTLETLTPPEAFRDIPQWTGTPLVSLIGGLFCWLFPEWRLGVWDQAIQSTLREWLRALHVGGIDLLEYGKRERIELRDPDSSCRGAFDADSVRVSSTIVRPWLTQGTTREPFNGPAYSSDADTWRPIRLLDVVYGPEPDDWSLLWVVEFEYMAYEFWMSVERLEAVMPGSWVE